jgi:hypothetical protein
MALCGGCTSGSLKHYTVNQALSVSDMRYNQVIHDLAAVAENSGKLPSFALTASGIANVSRTVSVDTTTLWDQAIKGFSKETLTAFGQHNPELIWTLSPVASEPQLEALYYACLWVTYGPPPEGSRPMELLRELRVEDLNGCALPGTTMPNPGFHFGVAKQLAALPHGWLHVTTNDCVPKHVSYRATCGNKTAWVSPEGMAGLSEFTLIVLDIATVAPTSLSVSPPTVSVAIQETAPPDGEQPPYEPVVNPKSTSTKKAIGGDKITETWNACQTPGGAKPGQITLIRPKNHKYATSDTPKVEMDPKAVPQLPGPPGQQIRDLLH